MDANKLDLNNIQGKLSRMEMKNIMAGCGAGGSSVKCCWSGTSNCSSCVTVGSGQAASCVGGAVLVSC